MCGIAGLIRGDLPAHKLKSIVEAMTLTLRHRGPDSFGHWLDYTDGAALGHRRLSIIDLSSSGRQPMLSESGRYVLTYNGEIYNFLELREEIVTGGGKFHGSSDTEVLLAIIDDLGVLGAIEKIAGMFAFAVWDRREKQLYLACDRIGIKPVFWCELGGGFAFASELKALRAIPGFDPPVSRRGLAQFVRYTYIPAPGTIFEGVSKLEPGTCLIWSAVGNTEIKSYWNSLQMGRRQTVARRTWSDVEAKAELAQTLGHAVRQHMISDVGLGAFLSGGVDSSIVVALMQANATEPIKTFTIGFEAASYDEAPYARMVAEYLGTDHTEVYVNDSDCLEVIPTLAYYFDEPFADSAQIPTMLVSQLARRDVTVCLVGDGGDEIFAGYDRYHWAARVIRLAEVLPAGSLRFAGNAIDFIPSWVWSVLNDAASINSSARVGERSKRLANMLKARGLDDLYERQLTYGVDAGTFVLGMDGSDARISVPQEHWSNEGLTLIEKLQLADLTINLPGDMLTRVDRASMAVGLEVRVPLLDHRVVQLAFALPPRMATRERQSKWILRQILYDFVPRELVERPKRGFRIPIELWLRGALRDWAEDLIEGERIEREGFFRADQLRRMWRAFLEGRHSVHQIWAILMFQSWLDCWQNSASGRSLAAEDEVRFQ